MTIHTNPQIINNEKGLPAFAVLPYAEYLSLVNKREINIENGIPSEVAHLALDNDISAAAAWRIHLGLSQEEVAKKIGVSQPAYSQYETSTKLRKTTLRKIADALGINIEQLMF